MGDVWLSSLDRKVWETYPSDELLTIRPRVFDGAASRFIQKYGTAMYHYTIGRMYKKVCQSPECLRMLLIGRQVHGPESVLAGTAYYTSHFIRRVVSLVTISISSLFPILAILILHFIQDQNAQIGIIVALTFAFSLCLGLFFQVRQGEIFAAAAAFAAVQVVFITGNGNGPNSNSKS